MGDFDGDGVDDIFWHRSWGMTSEGASASEPKGLVHLEDFEHSPFACDWNCCHSALGRITLVYLVVENNLADVDLVVDGELYVAIEPDRPCE